jgi:hypothetical protein
MKLLCLHADAFGYRFDHPTAGADQHAAGEGAEFGDALVVLLAVEPGDDEKINAAAKEIRHAAHRAGATRDRDQPLRPPDR